MTFQHGYNAQAAGATIADCPFAPSDPDGLEWRRGFIQAEWNARVMNGTAGATEEEKADARAWIADELRPDPVVEILGGYEELEPDPFAAHYAQHLVDLDAIDREPDPQFFVYTFNVDTRKFEEAMRELTNSLVKGLAPIAANVNAFARKFHDQWMAALDVASTDPANDAVWVIDPSKWEIITRSVAGPIPANGARKRTNTGRRKIPPREESRYTCPRHGIQDAGFCRACTVRRPQQFANRGRR